MFSYALSTGTQLATSYFHLPFDDEEDRDIENYERKHITWEPESATASSSTQLSILFQSVFSIGLLEFCESELDDFDGDLGIGPSSPSSASSHSTVPVSKGKNKASTSSTTQSDDSLIQEIIRDNDLYSILGVPTTGVLDKMTLRRAYLARSRGCHPDKFPLNPHATQAFQKVSVAYNVLSTPHLRRRYDDHRASRGPGLSSSSSGDNASAEFDVFASGRPSGFAEDTLRSVILGVFNDFLDNGDLEVIRNMLKALNEMNPGVKIGEEGIKSVLSTLHAIRERALSESISPQFI
ncbi:hypothetical protein EST38_g2586 [Candolleomyces aberdarensis]|uniref:J domain-containing protein n=1 Tax=Candolleomyces aberdarensis TaxID=2316362 RepID=A0A4V1Q4U1_9AGAR|nr:hypothetical protein EST38_g2586 [Candolleomyces aberdarensis]